MSVLLCESISNKVIHNFSFNFLNKKIYGILGKTDSGKESLLNLLKCNIKPDKGNIWIDGNILDKSLSSRIFYLEKNVSFPNLTHISTIFKKMKRKYPKWDNYLAFELVSYFKIRINDSWKSLTKEQRNLIIAICALASRANITIIDDPLCDQDLKNRYDFYNALYKHKEKYPRTFIIASDKVDDISFLFDKVLFLDKGRLIDYFNKSDFENFKILSGKPEAILSLTKEIKIIGKEEYNGLLSVCINKNITKDDKRKYQKYLIDVYEISIEKLFIFLTTLKNKKDKDIKVF